MHVAHSNGGGVGKPLAWCDDCGFEWHGMISAHGLRVIGRCPRCDGHLGFRDEVASVGRVEEHVVSTTTEDAGEDERQLQPWQVLGKPSSWDR